MHTELISSLDAPVLPLDVAGGKAANLHALRAAGFHTPPGFVVLTSAYRRFVEDNNLDSLIAEQWALCDPARPETFEAAAGRLRQAFAEGAPAGEITAAIAASYAQLGLNEAPDTPVAVRSSATAEDLPEASFAGQQETYLNVRGTAAVIAAVQRCWGSLWTARAMAYRLRQGIAPQDVSLAVVVQQMVLAQAAGVLFTINPISGDPSELVINATWGLGEALVSGQVTPDTLIVHKANGVIKQVVLGSKLLMTAAIDGDDGGTAELPVDIEMRARQALDAAQVAELARLGRALEEHFGRPQDVEWAIADDETGGGVVLLQTRPITTSASPLSSAAPVPPVPPGDDNWPPFDRPAQPFDLWTTYDVGERWPEPVTPFSWSTGYRMIQQNMDETLEGLQAPYAGRIQWAKRAFGHVYLNEGALTHAYHDGLGLPMGMIAPSMTGVVPVTAQNNRYLWGKMLRHLPFYLRSFTQWEANVKRYVAVFPQIDAWVDEFMRRDLAGLSDQEVWREAQTVWLARAMHYMRAHSNATSLSLTAYSQLEEFTERTMGDQSLAPKLAGGISGVIAAEIVPALWRLAREIEGLGLRDAVLEQPPDAALALLRSTPAAAPWPAHLDAFLARHGHRCMSEAEWLHPRWVEAPEIVMGSIQGYLRAGSGFDPGDAAAGAEQERSTATAAVEARLNPLQRVRFRRLLERVQRFMLARDNGQHYLVKLMLPVRRLYATLAARWAERSWLAQADDFFFLVQEEVEAVLAEPQTAGPQAAGLDLHRIAAARQEAYRFWFGQPMPDVLDAAGQPVALAVASEQSDEGTVLVGLAASRGTYTGVARVVLTPQEAAGIRPGEVLVTRATDPGWTPVFSVIGAAVIEIGSTLSHAAIVAREYGLPAVVNIPQATQLIRDGQTVRVDGDRGRITLFE